MAFLNQYYQQQRTPVMIPGQMQSAGQMQQMPGMGMAPVIPRMQGGGSSLPNFPSLGNQQAQQAQAAAAAQQSALNPQAVQKLAQQFGAPGATGQNPNAPGQTGAPQGLLASLFGPSAPVGSGTAGDGSAGVNVSNGPMGPGQNGTPMGQSTNGTWQSPQNALNAGGQWLGDQGSGIWNWAQGLFS